MIAHCGAGKGKNVGFGHVSMKATTACDSLEHLEQQRVASSCLFQLHPPPGRRPRWGWRSGCQWRTSWRTWTSYETWSPCLHQGHGGRVHERQLPRGVCCLGLLYWARQAGGVILNNQLFKINWNGAFYAVSMSIQMQECLLRQN